MSNAGYIRIIKSYINAKALQFHRFEPDKAAANAERDRILALLKALAPDEPMPTQAAIAPTPHPIVEPDPEISRKIEKINERIRAADNTGKFADRAELVAQRARLLGRQGL
jgi:hypothetical protein